MAQRQRTDANGTDLEPFLELGMMHASGRSGAADLVAAHKWFNLAAMHGNAEAARLRLEIAEQMSRDEIAAAQRAAREWLRAH
jgi:TPR repeat protein